ncbi:precorrin-6Y C5,15-methyltransferase (decarboxylating) subunit CbiT [Halanaerobacter jeridensis]|uniref:Cobalt-precorrin-6B (C15)-methyltransferase n=1 Tax=Halanaerobacter jeridensis TaxID=706427 RepID=A0A939BR90_9FIRM|nr:precorrin-6Y C5,15-methyltransferase (decarboxylating) subunit CbiT [Halanaerobacter jeridensis]MBM7557124.1 cobalt-precorrin-6B (C15)-methyltransferase [Halanaerobacter jeridensis]
MMSEWQYRTPGIPDDKFIRGQIPMTKEEVRAVTIAKLRLNKDSTVYDIGAGTGSVTVETALKAVTGTVYAIERDAEGVDLIQQNIDKFSIDNVEVISGTAPAVLKELPPVERVMIGGSGGQLKEILAVVDKKLAMGGRVVINAITLDTLDLARTELARLDYEVEICNLAVTRTKEVGNYQMLDGLNPIYIICGEKRCQDEAR